MKKRTKIAVVASAAIAVGAIGTGVAVAGNGDIDVAITGSALEQAKAAALAHMGEGRVTGTEVGDEDSYYEVEVTLDDGRQVDVQLDEQFVVVDQLSDSESAGD